MVLLESVKIDETKLDEYALLAKDWCLVNGNLTYFKLIIF